MPRLAAILAAVMVLSPAGLAVEVLQTLPPVPTGLGADVQAVYIAPDGQAGAAGTKEAPLSLAAACARKDFAPGTVLWLKGGAYPMPEKAVIAWKGTAEKRIVLRSAPGEWAVLDGRLDVMNGAACVTLRDFEITRTRDENKNDPGWWKKPAKERISYSEKRPDALEFSMGGGLVEVRESDSIQLVNLYAHDNVSGDCFGAWNTARNTLIYGCLMVRNGWEDRVRGHGHGAYVQNGWPQDKFGTSWKLFRHCISAYNNATGAKSYGDRPDILHTLYQSNIFFCNGMRAWTNGSANFLVGSHKGILDDIVLTGNHFYQPDSCTGDVGGRVYLGWGGDKKKEGCVFTGNYVFGGGADAVCAQHWKSLTFTGNTIYDDKKFVTVADFENRMKNWKWDHNTYYENGQARPFSGPGGQMSFTEWKARTGFDAASTLIPNKPKGTQAYLFPNECDPDRAHVALYNWDKLPAVDLDLSSFLKKGDKFILYDSLDFRGKPVATGEFSGGKVAAQLVESPCGREFYALVLLRLDAGRQAEWKALQRQ